MGLGHDFLRHIERTRVLIHVVDVSGMEGRDPIDDFIKINNELRLYNEKLSQRVQLVAANKMDMPDSQENFEKLRDFVTKEGFKIFPVSFLTFTICIILMMYLTLSLLL